MKRSTEFGTERTVGAAGAKQNLRDAGCTVISGRFRNEPGRILERSEDTFQQKLFKLIEESGMDDVTVYKKANIDRRCFRESDVRRL